jgi:hypothetical protein
MFSSMGLNEFSDGRNYERTEHLRKAVVLYRYCAKFIKDNQIDSQQQLASTCLEMASLVHENAEMMRVCSSPLS